MRQGAVLSVIPTFTILAITYIHMAKDQGTPVGDIAQDDQKLKEKAKDLVRRFWRLKQYVPY